MTVKVNLKGSLTEVAVVWQRLVTEYRIIHSKNKLIKPRTKESEPIVAFEGQIINPAKL